MKIEIRPIATKRWHGKEGEDSIQRPTKLYPLADPATMQYATGLSYTGKYDHPDNKGNLTEAEFYGRLLKQDLSPQFDKNTPHPFWDSPQAAIVLDNKPVFLDTSKTLDYIRHKVARASKYIANSKKEYDEGKFPYATHVIFTEEEDKEEKASKIAIKNKVIVKLQSMSAGAKIQLATILTGKTCKKQSANYIDVILDEEINKNAKDVLRYMEMDKTDISIHALVLEALHFNVLRKIKHQIFYQDSMIGMDVLDVVDYLKQEDNQELKLRIIAAIN